MWIEKFSKKKSNPKKVKDKSIIEFIYKKTGLKLQYFYLYDFDKSHAVIAGIPGFPQMFLSVNAYKNFNKNELDWLLLHEVGHYKLWHSTKEAIQQLILLVIGVFILFRFTNPFLILVLSIPFAIILGAIGIQLAKNHEYEAENYAHEKLDNTKGMISTGEKSIEGWKKKGLPEHSLLHTLFDRWEISMFYRRIRLAKTRK